MKIETLNATTFIPYKDGLETTKEKLLSYYRTGITGLNYEYKNDSNYELIFITGKNQEEKEFSRFYLPLTYRTASGKLLIFVDMRSTVNIDNNKDFKNIKDIVRDRTMFDIKISHLAIICEFLKNETLDNEYVMITIKAFSTILANVISNNLSLDIIDSTDLKIVLAYYYAAITYPEKDHDNLLIIAAKTTIGINKVDEVENIIKNIPENITNIEDLLEMFKTNLSNSRVSKLNKVTLSMIINSLLYGVEIKQYLSVSVENTFVFMCLLYTSHTNRAFKRTPMATILHSQGRYLDIKEFAKRTENFIKQL